MVDGAVSGNGLFRREGCDLGGLVPGGKYVSGIFVFAFLGSWAVSFYVHSGGVCCFDQLSN
jgi:hypothetical protein